MQIYKQKEIYRGKAKTLYATNNSNLLVLKFRDNISANNGRITSKFKNKGLINNKISFFLMQKLEDFGIPTQIESLISKNETLVKKLNMIPIEYVLRNMTAGSLVRRMNIKEGILLNPPILDMFLKDDAMNDPMINDSYCESFNWANKSDLSYIRETIYRINSILGKIFVDAGLILVDFKLEFGLFNNKLVLGDELSPDNMRLWDKISAQKMDKDIFRQGFDILDVYKEVANRLGVLKS